MITVQCSVCGKEVQIWKCRATTFKACSRKCKGILSRNTSKKMSKRCPICKKKFLVKTSHSRRRKYCSKQCQGAAYAERYLGTENPNYRGRKEDYDGYPMKIPINGKSVVVHRAVVYEYLGVKKLGKNWTIHHRDCNIHNPVKENLVVLSRSDHKWLHKQFGSAGLWAYLHGKIYLDILVSWSNDPERAKRLLPLDLTQQKNWNFVDLPTIHSYKGSRPKPNPTIRQKVAEIVTQTATGM